MSKSLITRMLAVRESWFEIEPGKRVKIRRPAEVEMAELRDGIKPEHLKRFVVAWEGFTEADLLGPAVGGDVVVAFDADVWTAALLDRGDWFTKTANEVSRLVMEHIQTKVEARKN